MKILQTLQSILNYILKYIKANTLEVSQIEFSDGTVQDTAPTSAENANKLYDLKVLPQAIIEKGWLAICKQTRIDLLKSQVPTLYQDIYDKYDVIKPIDYDYQKFVPPLQPIAYFNGYYYGINTDQTAEKWQRIIYKSKYTTMEAAEQVIDLTTISGINEAISYTNSYYGECQRVFIKTYGNYIAIIVGQGTITPNNNWTLILFDNNFNFINSIVLPLTYSSYGYENARLKMPSYFYFEDGYIYIGDRLTLYKYDLSLTQIDSYNLVYSTYTTIEEVGMSLVFKGNYIYYSYKGSGISTGFFLRIDVTTKEIELLGNDYANTARSQGYVYLDCLGLVQFFGGKSFIREQSDGTFVKTSNVSISGNYEDMFQDVIIDGNIAYFYTFTNMTNTNHRTNRLCKTTDNFQTWEVLYSSGINQGGYQTGFVIVNTNRPTLFMQNNDILAQVNDGWILSGRVDNVFTDSYTINGSQVLINYYKYDTFKICVPNDTNDTNLQTVYEFLGYLPYWRIDLTHETVSPIMDSRLWSLMYVGDNYEDITLPDGSFERSLIYSDITNLANQIIGQITTKPTRQDFSNFTDGDTTLDLSSLTSDTNDQIYIYKNGILLTITDDYTIENFTVTFVTALTASDKITIVIFK